MCSNKTYLQFFEEICSIPHVSGNEKGLAEYLLRFAKERGFWSYTDELNNVIIKKEASNKDTSNQDASAAVILQSHIDMVGAKTDDSTHNFDTDPIKFIIEGDYLHADNTTLGADDGIGCAMMLAVLDNDTIAHPALECVFTSGEEIGLIGAGGLDMSHLRAKRMINLDAGPLGSFIVSCAGGVKLKLTKACSPQPCDVQHAYSVYDVHISGLLGGHSGGMINQERANAIKLMGILLRDMQRSLPTDVNLHIVSISGGDADNAIPRFCNARIAITSEDPEVLSAMNNAFECTVNDLRVYFPNEECMSIELISTPSPAPTELLNAETSSKLIRLLHMLPTGVRRRSLTVADLPELSDNIGILRMDDGLINIQVSVRSDAEEKKSILCDEIEDIATLLGFEAARSGNYPGWPMDTESPFLEHCAKVYENEYGHKPQVFGIHAGLECGYFKGKLPGLEIVAMGPENEFIHTPQERTYLPSCEKLWSYLCKVLETA